MGDPSSRMQEQEAIRAKCFHPTGTFVEFKKEEIEQSIPERFEKMVRQYTERLAVKMGDRALRYDQLNQAANRIARLILEKRGPGSEPIAVLFEHGIDGIAAIFGVLKAGKFYVALDPSFPERRINYILDDSEAPLIVTNHRNLALARKLTNDQRLALSIDDIDQTVSSDNLGLFVYPENPCAIIYTSGSTGEPKGVLETHRYRLYETMIRTNEALVCPDDRLSLLHSVTFASALVNLTQALLNGASLFPFDIKSKGVDSLSKWLRAEQITILHMPPILFRQFAQSLSGEDKFPNLRVVHLSGAPITARDFDLYRRTFSPDAVFAFHMGATETALICSAVTDHTFSFPKDGVPVGYPAKGKQILLLNDKGEEVGSGEVGEIAVKSVWLAAGYWRNPQLTKAKFLPDPSGCDERTYLTGDLGRMLPDGFLIHLGRKDFMVKIRGYRVDISEIERALLGHDQVKEAGVVAWDHEPGETCLVAYVVPRGSPPPTIHRLNEFLRTKLPDYMIPSSFMFLESFPLTNGKLDRSALPKPGKSRPELGAPVVPPRTPVEEQLAEIWAEVLSLDQVGIHDNFFDLGGHSLAATRVVSQVIKRFQLEIPLQSLFQSPTVAEIAAVITEHQRKKLGEDDLHRILTELESLSDEEAQRLLSEQKTNPTGVK